MKRILLLLLLLLTITSVLKAQDTEFWFVAPDLDDTPNGCAAGQPFDSPMLFAISNNSSQNGSVTITFYNGTNAPVIVTQNIAAGGLFTYNIPIANKSIVENPRGSAGNVTNFGVHITSTVPVTAYYQILAPCNQDVYALKGSSALGNEFYVPMMHDSHFYTVPSSYPTAYDQIDIVATVNNTTVTIVPTAEVRIVGSTPVSAGTPIVRTMNRGETLKIMKNAQSNSASSPKLAGTKITSTQPIAVTTTEDLVGLPSAWDIIGDQIVPVNALGSDYIIARGYMSQADRVYIIATEDNTNIIANSGTTSTVTLSAGQRWVYTIPTTANAAYITSNNPIYCYQVSAVGLELGAALIPSIYSIGQTEISFYQYAGSSSDSHSGFVVFRDGAQNNFTITYNNITSNLSVTALNVPGNSEWKVAKITLPTQAQNRVVKIANTVSPFSFGYFGVGGGGSSYGYLSAFGDFDFGYDTLYYCGNNFTLQGGYAINYTWKYSSTKNGTYSTIISSPTATSLVAANDGYYVLEMNQDPTIVRDTVYAQKLVFQASILPLAILNIETSTVFSASINPILTGDPNLAISYLWEFEGGSSTNPTSATPTVTWVSGERKAKLTLTALANSARSIGSCDTIIQAIPVIYQVPEVAACRGEIATLTASLETAGSVSNPVFYWYDAPIGGNRIHTGDTLTTSTYIMSDTIFYVSLEGDDYCEGERLPIIVTVGDCSELVDDYTTTFIGKNDTIPVLDNDKYPAFCEPAAPVITTPPSASGATADVVGRNIVYRPAPGFTGRDSVKYTIACGGVTDTATVYITVIPYPDNISDADCYVDPPGTPWTIAKLAENTDYLVNHCMIPIVGDIDNDGFIEIIVGRATYTGNEVNSNGLLIYKFRNNQLELQQNLTTPYMNANATSVSIANVDGGNYAAIFITTSSFASPGYSSTQQAANLSRKLVKYIFNGTEYVLQTPVENCPQYSDVLKKDAAQPMLVDFNGDGIAEVVVLDKVYNARTLELLANGNVLSSTYPATNYQYGLGYGGHPNNNNTGDHFTYKTSHMVVADMDNDGIPEIVAGHCVYKVNITNPLGVANNSFTLWSKCDGTNISGATHPGVKDGATAVADMDGDGYLDVIVTGMTTDSYNDGSMFIWNPRTKKVMHTTVLNNIHSYVQHGPSRPFIGDVDNDGMPEIAFMTSVNSSTGRLYCYDYDPVAKTLEEKWFFTNGDPSGSTILTLFDFNMDGFAELVYRDSYDLHIINGENGVIKQSIGGLNNTTANEYPVVADINGDGSAEIITTGNSRLQVFASNPVGMWAPARKVWNQASYNAVNVNDDLTIPRYMLNPATKFPGPDEKSGTADDVRPYNNFLQQQTMLNKYGNPLWLAPDAAVDRVLSSISNSDNEITINACFENIGDASINAPIYVSLYADSISSTSRITTDSVDIKLLVYESGCISITFDGSIYPDMLNIIVRINDREGVFPYQPECREYNNTISFVNPLKFRKEATLMLTPVFKHNGTYANPVSVLFNEDILYEITAINPKRSPASITITDTIPAYLRYVPGSAMPNDGTASIDSSRLSIDNSLKWTFTGVPSIDSRTVSFKATPVDGASASQPLYINYARVIVAGIDPDGGPDMHYAITNNTYHQGAGISLMTFSAGFGGSIYNADEQALDYMSKPRSGVIIAPDEGYRFAGWSHGGYTSLRGAFIAAQEGIMLYDTLTVYGNVELHASFVPVEESLDDDEEEVVIKSLETDDKAWAVDDELYVKTNNANSIVRIYSLDGVLRGQHTIIMPGITTKKLSRGIYVVTINNGLGVKILIE